MSGVVNVWTHGCMSVYVCICVCNMSVCMFVCFTGTLECACLYVCMYVFCICLYMCTEVKTSDTYFYYDTMLLNLLLCMHVLMEKCIYLRPNRVEYCGILRSKVSHRLKEAHKASVSCGVPVSSRPWLIVEESLGGAGAWHGS